MRWEISSIPIRRRLASRSTSRPASAATRSQIRPTLRQAIRIGSATALPELGPQVQEVVSRIRQEWRYGGAGFKQRLRDRWNAEFDPVTVRIDPARARGFDEIEPQIDRLFKDPVQVLTLNSTTEDELDYEAEPFLKAILIGGNRLSRGMTLEGLLVSYFVRPSPYYDTLLQEVESINTLKMFRSHLPEKQWSLAEAAVARGLLLGRLVEQPAEAGGAEIEAASGAVGIGCSRPFSGTSCNGVYCSPPTRHSGAESGVISAISR